MYYTAARGDLFEPQEGVSSRVNNTKIRGLTNKEENLVPGKAGFPSYCRITFPAH